MGTGASDSRGHMILQVGHMPHEVHHTGKADLGRRWSVALGLSSLQATSVLPRRVERDPGSLRRGPSCWEGPLTAPPGRLLQADASVPWDQSW